MKEYGIYKENDYILWKWVVSTRDYLQDDWFFVQRFITKWGAEKVIIQMENEEKQYARRQSLTNKVECTD